MNNSLSKIISNKKSEKSKKLYQIWKGRNKFCLNGKIYIGSEYYFGLLTTFYILINILFYLIFVIKVSKINIFYSRELNIKHGYFIL